MSSSQPLQAFVLVLKSPMAQVARIARSLGDSNAVDVEALFGDPQFVNHGDSAIDMELVPQHGFFQRQPLKVFKRNQGFSFQPNEDAATEVVEMQAKAFQFVAAPSTSNFAPADCPSYRVVV